MTLDQRAGARLQMNEQQVAQMRSQWEDSPTANVIKCMLALKLEDLAAEQTQKLRKCAPEELKRLQGALDMLDIAIATVQTRLVSTAIT